MPVILGAGPLKTLSKQLSELGFHVDYATYIFSLLPIPIFLFRSLPYRLGLIKKTNWQARYKKEHSQKKGILGKLLEKTWNKELKRIRSQRIIPFGSSCLIAASHPAVFGWDDRYSFRLDGGKRGSESP